MPGKKKFCKRRLLREATKRVQNSVLYHWPLTVRLSFFFFFFPLLRLLLVRIGESTRGEVASTRFARENWPLVKEAICNSRGLILRGNDRLGTLPPPSSYLADLPARGFRRRWSRGFYSICMLGKHSLVRSVKN